LFDQPALGNLGETEKKEGVQKGRGEEQNNTERKSRSGSMNSPVPQVRGKRGKKRTKEKTHQRQHYVVGMRGSFAGDE